MLVPPRTFYIDEAGSLDFSLPKAGERKKALAFISVAVPMERLNAAFAVLPRRLNGEFLKSSDRDFSPDMATAFADRLIASPCEVGAFLCDPGAPENIAHAERLTKAANEGRKRQRAMETTNEGRRQHPDISQHDLNYLNFTSQALFACMQSIASRQSRPTFFNVIMDTQTIAPHQRTWFSQQFKRVAEQFCTRIDQIAWKTEQEEPLLLLPDILGGILCRADRGFADARRAAGKLWDAERDGRFKFLNKAPSQGWAGPRDSATANTCT